MRLNFHKRNVTEIDDLSKVKMQRFTSQQHIPPSREHGRKAAAMTKRENHRLQILNPNDSQLQSVREINTTKQQKTTQFQTNSVLHSSNRINFSSHRYSPRNAQSALFNPVATSQDNIAIIESAPTKKGGNQIAHTFISNESSEDNVTLNDSILNLRKVRNKNMSILNPSKDEQFRVLKMEENIQNMKKSQNNPLLNLSLLKDVNPDTFNSSSQGKSFLNQKIGKNIRKELIRSPLPELLAGSEVGFSSVNSAAPRTTKAALNATDLKIDGRLIKQIVSQMKEERIKKMDKPRQNTDMAQSDRQDIISMYTQKVGSAEEETPLAGSSRRPLRMGPQQPISQFKRADLILINGSGSPGSNTQVNFHQGGPAFKMRSNSIFGGKISQNGPRRRESITRNTKKNAFTNSSDLGGTDLINPSDRQTRISRFMSQSEKERIWIEEQRNAIIQKSAELEQNIISELKEQEKLAKEKNESPNRRKSSRLEVITKPKPIATEPDQIKVSKSVVVTGRLPKIDDLKSKGTNLRDRIDNYHQNLSALEGPIMDGISDCIKNFDMSLLKFRVKEEKEQSLKKKKKLPRQPSFKKKVLGDVRKIKMTTQTEKYLNADLEQSIADRSAKAAAAAAGAKKGSQFQHAINELGSSSSLSSVTETSQTTQPRMKMSQFSTNVISNQKQVQHGLLKKKSIISKLSTSGQGAGGVTFGSLARMASLGVESSVDSSKLKASQTPHRSTTSRMLSSSKYINRFKSRLMASSKKSKQKTEEFKTKEKIQEELEARKIKQLLKQKKRGQRMRGSHGSLDKAKVKNLQENWKRKLKQYVHERQVDKLIYKHMSIESSSNSSDDSETKELRRLETTIDNKFELKQLKQLRQIIIEECPSHQKKQYFIKYYKNRSITLRNKIYNRQNLRDFKKKKKMTLAQEIMELNYLNRHTQRHVNNICMVNDQFPPQDTRNEEIKKDNKVFIQYLNSLHQSIEKPQASPIKRKACLFPKQYAEDQSSVTGTAAEQLKQKRIAEYKKQGHRGKRMNEDYSPKKFTPFDSSKLGGLPPTFGSSRLKTDQSYGVEIENEEVANELKELATEIGQNKVNSPAARDDEEEEEDPLDQIQKQPNHSDFSEDPDPQFSEDSFRSDLTLDLLDSKLREQLGGYDDGRNNQLSVKSQVTTTSFEESSDSFRLTNIPQSIDSDISLEEQKELFRKKQVISDSKQTINSISKALVSKLKSISQKRKVVTNFQSSTETIEGAPFTYFLQCMKEHQVDVPIFDLVQEQRLVVLDRKVNLEQCKAIQMAFKTLNTAPKSKIGLRRDMIMHLHFSSNGFTDEESSIIVNAVVYQKALASIRLEKNEVGIKTIDRINQIIYKPVPNNLRQLILIDCSLQVAETDKLLEFLRPRCTLEQLTLHKASFSTRGIDHLCHIVSTSSTLTWIELQWMKMALGKTHSSYKRVLHALCSSGMIKHVDLSWNSLINEGALRGQEDWYEQQLEIATLINRLSRSKTLQHLILENTGITIFMIEKICDGLRKARCLQSVHLSNNPFIVQLVTNASTRLANQKVPKQGKHGLVSDFTLDEMLTFMKNKIRAKALAKERPAMTAMAHLERTVNAPQTKDEQFQLSRLKTQLDNFQVVKENSKDPFWSNTFVVQRKLGHKKVLNKPGQWEIATDFQKHNTHILGGLDRHQGCWICKKSHFALVFWSSSIQKQIEQQQRRLQDMHKATYVFHLSQGEIKGDIKLNKSPLKTNSLQRGQTNTSKPSDQGDRTNSSAFRTPGVFLRQSSSPSKPNFGFQQKSNIQSTDQRRRKAIHFPSISPAASSRARMPVVQVPESSVMATPLPSEQPTLIEKMQARASMAFHAEFGHKGDIFKSSRIAKAPLLFSGSIQNWKAQEMIEVGEFCKKIDIDPKTGDPKYEEPDIIQILKDRKQISNSVFSYDQLKPNEQALYEIEKVQQDIEYRKQWLQIILKNLPYRNPMMVNSDLATEVILDFEKREKIFVLPLYITPGKHTYCVQYTEREQSPGRDELADRINQFTLQSVMVPMRQEQIPEGLKEMLASSKNERRFKKDQSVFSAWVEDSKRIQAQCFDSVDFVNWKVPRFIKDEEQVEKVKNYFKSRFRIIKELYSNLQAESPSFPGISQSTISNFCQVSGIIDKDFLLSTADRLYIASTVKLFNEKYEEKKRERKPRGDNPDSITSINDMLRTEFLEFILRVVKFKFIETGVCTNYIQALNKFFDHHVPRYDLYSGQGFRDTYLWTVEANDLLITNLDNLKKVYHCLYYRPRKNMNYKDAMRFMCENFEFKRKIQIHQASTIASKTKQRMILDDDDLTLPEEIHAALQSNEQASRVGNSFMLSMESSDLSLHLTEKQARLCYSLSKMTVVDEMLDGVEKYDKLSFVEFLELLGRIAFVKFEDQEVSFIQKLSLILDIVLQIVGAERQQAATKEQLSSSEVEDIY